MQTLDLRGHSNIKAAALMTLTSSASHTPYEFALPVTQLTTINLIGCRQLTTHSLHHLLLRSPKVQQVILKGLDCVTDTTLTEVLAPHATDLELLDIGRCKNVGGKALRIYANLILDRIGRMNPDRPNGDEVEMPARGWDGGRLRLLKASGMRDVDMRVVRDVGRAFPALRHLDFSHCKDIEDSALRELVAWFPGPFHSAADTTPQPWHRFHASLLLTSREAGFDPGDPTKHQRHLLSHLRHLNLSGCRGLSDTGIGYLAHCVPNLEILEVASMGDGMRSGIGDEGLVRLFQTTKKIRRIDLEDAMDITDHTLDVLTPPSSDRRRGEERELETGDRLEHLVVSFAMELSPEAFTRLIRGCKALKVLEADNTRISSGVIREFVTLRRKRERRARNESSASSGSALIFSGIGGSEIVATDCRSVTTALIEDLKTMTRPRRGFRTYDARFLDFEDGAAVTLSIAQGGGPLVGQDECDETKVVFKSFHGWTVLDEVRQKRDKRKLKAQTGGSSGAGDIVTGSSTPSGRVWGRRSAGHNTPHGEDGFDRGATCIIM